MRDNRESSSGVGVVIAASAVALVLLVCGGGALLVAGLVFYTRAEAVYITPPPPQVVTTVDSEPAHADVLFVTADGNLQWNDAPVTTAELRERLDQLKNAGGPPRSVIVRGDPAAPMVALDEALQLLSDRQVGYIIEQGE